MRIDTDCYFNHFKMQYLIKRTTSTIVVSCPDEAKAIMAYQAIKEALEKIQEDEV